MSKGFATSSKRNPCPVCDRTKDTDCRTKEGDNLVLCHSLTADHPDGTNRGYKFLHPSKDNLWGVWIFDDSKGRKPPKPARSENDRATYLYPNRSGNPLIRVQRNKTGNPPFWQEFWVNGRWVSGGKLPDSVKQPLFAQVAIYRYAEVRQAIANGEPVFWVEGEKCADALWKLGLPAITSIGGSKRYRAYGSYKADLEGATLILCPDRDLVGMEYMSEVATDFPDAQWCYVYPDSVVYPLPWQRIPKDHGLDIADWITEGATVSDIMEAVGTRDRASAKAETNGKAPLLETEELVAQLNQLIAQNLPQSSLEARIPELAKASGRQSNDIWRLYRARLEELEQEDTRQTRSKELSGIMAIARQELKLAEYLDPVLAEPLERVAAGLGSNAAAMLTTLLPTAGTLLKVGTKLELAAATSFYALPILYTGILAESGSAKSPTQKTILEPLFEMQAEANDEYNYRLEEYEAARKTRPDDCPPKPKPREYYTIDSTREAIATIQSQQPDRGFLGWFDELSALIGGQNQYRNGKGTDKEAILSGRDGTGIKVNRASGKRIYAPHSAYSITGSTQPDTLKKLIGDFGDPSGQWARFLWATLPLKANTHPDSSPAYNVKGLLGGLYHQLEQQEPQIYRFSPEAKKLYVDWFNRLDARRMNEPQQGLRAVFAKMKGDTGVLALLLHCINAAAQGRQPDPFVSVATLTSAIKLSQYYLGQVRLIHAEGDGEGTIEDSCSRIIKISQRKGWITARDVHIADRQIRKRLSTEAVRSLFRELEAMDMGKTSGSGVHIEFCWHSVDTDGADAVLTVEGAMVDYRAADNDLNIFTATLPTKSPPNGQHPETLTVSAVDTVPTKRLQNANKPPTMATEVPTKSRSTDLDPKKAGNFVGTPLADCRQPVDTLLAPRPKLKSQSAQGFSKSVDKNVGVVDTRLDQIIDGEREDVSLGGDP